MTTLPTPHTPRNRRRKTAPKLSRTSLIVLGICIVLMIAGGIFAIIKASEDRLWDPVSKKELNSALSQNPDLPEDVQTVVDSAVSLVGKVHYFWGGKSKSFGWDDHWGKFTKVTSEGSSTTGTYRPFGLDCSGYVTWCFIQTGYDWEQAVNLVGNGTVNQWERSQEIPWDSLQAGDFAFQHKPGDPEGNHIGICIGFDQQGEPLFAHCAAGENNVVVTHADDVFRYARRPNVFCEE